MDDRIFSLMEFVENVVTHAACKIYFFVDLIFFSVQVERPVTLKKDGIQTRNRKLSAKSKKKKSGMSDFFRSGLDARYGGFPGSMGMSGMSPGFSSPMSGYYSQMSPMSGMSSQYMGAIPSSMQSMYMASMSGAGNSGLSLSPHSHGAFSLGSPSIPNSIVAGATA